MGQEPSAFQDTETLSLALAAQMISIAKNINLETANKEALGALDSGKAFEVFEKVCRHQGGDLNSLPMPTQKLEVKTSSSGYLKAINSESVGVAGISLGAGRRVITDKINPVAGIQTHKKIGDHLNSGETIFTIHSDSSASGSHEAATLLQSCYELSSEKVTPEQLILQTGL